MAIINVRVQDRQTLLDVAIQYLGDAIGAIDLAQLNNIAMTGTLPAGQLLKVDTSQVINAKVVSYLREKDVVPITDLGIASDAPIIPGNPGAVGGGNNDIPPAVNPPTSEGSGNQVLVPTTMEAEFKEVAIATPDFNGWIKYRKIGAQVELHLHVTYTTDHEVNYLLHQMEVEYRPKESVLVPAAEFYPSDLGAMADIVSIDSVSGEISSYRSRGINNRLQIHCFYAYV